MLKRDLTLFFRALLSSALLLVLVISVSAGAAVLMIRDSARDSDTICIAVVDNEDSVMSRILIHTASETDYIRSLLTVETAEEAEAMAGMESGRYAAVILLPEDFVSDVLHGRESRGKIYLSPAMLAQSNIITSTVHFGERLLLSGQLAVFVGDRLLSEHNIGGEERNSAMTAVNAHLLSHALEASRLYFAEETVSYGYVGMTEGENFVLCTLAAILFLLSVFFTPVFLTDCKRDVLRRLYSFRVGPLRFMFWKIALLTAFRYILIVAAMLILPDSLCPHPNFMIPLAAALFITLVSACLTLCTGDGITSVTMITMAGMLLCGGLVPARLLPAGVQIIGRLTPFGAAVSLLSPSMSTSADWLGAGMALVYTIISVVLLRRKLRGIVYGRYA